MKLKADTTTIIENTEPYIPCDRYTLLVASNDDLTNPTMTLAFDIFQWIKEVYCQLSSKERNKICNEITDSMLETCSVVSVFFDNNTDKPVSFLFVQDNNIFVGTLKEYRRLGFAKKLIRDAAWELRKEKELFYSASEDNIESINLSKTLGFKEI